MSIGSTMHIIIKGEDLTIPLEIEKKFLNEIPYLKSLLTFENVEIPVVEVKNAQIVYDIIVRRRKWIKKIEEQCERSIRLALDNPDYLVNYDTEEDFEENPIDISVSAKLNQIVFEPLNKCHWSYQLEVVRCKDFLGLEPSLSLKLKVPEEGFDLLLEIAHLIGFSDMVIKVINNNLPEEYPLENLSIDLIKQMYKAKLKYYIVSGSQDCTIKYWDMEGAWFKTLEGHTKGINSLVFSPSNKYLISASGQAEVKIWDGVKGEFIGEVNSSYCCLGDIVYSNDYLYIAAAYNDSIKIWDFKGDLICKIQAPTYTTSIAFSHDNRHLVSTSFEHKINIFDVQTGKLIANFPEDVSCITRAIYTPDDKNIISGSTDGTIDIWDVESCTLNKTLKGHTSWVNCLLTIPIENDLMKRLSEYL